MSIKIKAIVICIFCFTILASAQDVTFGTNNYIEYQAGTLPFVISVAHGGSIEPSSIPNRTCNNPVYATDAFTLETALEIKNYLFTTTGCYPHLIISHLKRNKLDPNRNVTDGACGNPQAETAWNEFHNFITDARNSANEQFNNQTFFVDLHGHGNPIQRIELGYLLYDYELEFSDSTLNSNQYIDFSTIQNLAYNNLNNYTHAQLLRGPKSFGSLLANQNYPSVPSESIPSPGTTTNYFSGGYITANHTSYSSNLDINGLQMELNYTGIRNTHSNRTEFAMAFSKAIIEYMDTHFNMVWNSCTPVLSINENTLNVLPEFYPNPVKKGELFYIDNLENKTYIYYLYNYLGQALKIGKLRKLENSIDTKNLESGIYVIYISNMQSGEKVIKKLIIN
jgi:N-formylglutamate amidohydrolase